MNPITHFLVGWITLERSLSARRDKALVCVAGVLPDLDGAGILIDFTTRLLELPATDYYQAFHRVYGHGLPAALLIAGLAALCARRRLPVFMLALLAVHLHLLCDVLGSRGSTPQDIWPVSYLSPLSTEWALSWSGQWPLVGWQNMAISVVLLLLCFRRAATFGYSPLSLVSTRADAVFVAVLRQWRQRFAARRRSPP